MEIETGKTLIVKLVTVGEPQSDATRVIYFELNGQPREVNIEDMGVESVTVRKQKRISNVDISLPRCRELF